MAIDPKTAAVFASAIAHDLDVFEPTPVPDVTVAPIEDLLWSLNNGRVVLAPLMQDKSRG
jgi:hypothetical protein